VNRRELEKHLREHHGGNHDIWINAANKKTAPVPRHNVVKRGTVRSIRKKLEVPLPPGF
jgi:hypothetical protein